MGYACPVCSEPQADATHLANHVAFSALTGDESHEAWLDETVPEWGQLGEDALGEQVVAYADEVDLPTEIEGGAGRTHDRDEPAAERRSHATGVGAPSADDDETEAVLEAARELTRRMQGERADDAGEDSSNGDSTDGDDDSETE